MQTYSLTIKHVTPRGEVNIHAASRVSFVPSNMHPGANDLDAVYADLENGVTGSFDGGTVYVMNASGRTVDTFRLAGTKPFSD